jgi:microcystin-dependent protein
MSQSSYTFGNISASQLRVNFQESILANVSNNIGPSFPTKTFAGMWYISQTSLDIWIRNGNDTSWVLVGNIGIPGLGLGQAVGDYFWSRRESIPKCLKCEGQAIARSTYNALFALQGVEQGAGDGSTTFNIYNARGRTNAAPNPANSSNGLSARNLGAYYGRETAQLEARHNGPHTHLGDRRSIGTATESRSGILYDNGGAGFQQDQGIGLQTSGSGDAFSIIGPTGTPGYFYQRVLP